MPTLPSIKALKQVIKKTIGDDKPSKESDPCGASSASALQPGGGLEVGGPGRLTMPFGLLGALPAAGPTGPRGRPGKSVPGRKQYRPLHSRAPPAPLRPSPSPAQPALHPNAHDEGGIACNNDELLRIQRE